MDIMPLLLEWGEKIDFPNIIVYIVMVMVCQNCQVTVASVGCCWSRRGAPRVPIVGALAPSWEDGCRETEGDSGIVIEDVFEDAT